MGTYLLNALTRDWLGYFRGYSVNTTDLGGANFAPTPYREQLEHVVKFKQRSKDLGNLSKKANVVDLGLTDDVKGQIIVKCLAICHVCFCRV